MDGAQLLGYERTFVPSLVWLVQGAFLQYRGRMVIRDGAGTEVYTARSSAARGVFAAFCLAMLALTSLGVATFAGFAVGRPRAALFVDGGMAAGLVCLAAAGVTLGVATWGLRITVERHGQVAMVMRRRFGLWELRDWEGVVLGALMEPASGRRGIVDKGGKTLLGVVPRTNAVFTGDGTARGKMWIRAGARVEMDDEFAEVDFRLLAALLLVTAVEQRAESWSYIGLRR